MATCRPARPTRSSSRRWARARSMRSCSCAASQAPSRQACRNCAGLSPVRSAPTPISATAAPASRSKTGTSGMSSIRRLIRRRISRWTARNGSPWAPRSWVDVAPPRRIISRPCARWCPKARNRTQPLGTGPRSDPALACRVRANRLLALGIPVLRGVPLPRSAETALLPAGLQDVLPPEAAHEAATVERLMGVFAGHGYDRVKPPLVEFEESLLSGPGAAMAKRSFRLMDPVSHRMMALRADMTLQVARIAATRLAREARPLRLSYAGQVLRVKGSSLRPERQFGQAGVELIGAASARADAEAILLAAEALEAVGVEGLTIDLNLPSLVPILDGGLGLA